MSKSVEPERIRAFIAIYPDELVLTKLTQLVSRLRQLLPSRELRWTKLEQLHLTLQFLGYVESERLDQMKIAVEKAAREMESFSLDAAALGCFPSVSRPRVLWVGINGQVEKLQGLKTSLDKALQPLGYKPEERPYHPHFTLARVGEIRGKDRAAIRAVIDDHKDYRAGQFDVRSLELMQSVLTPQGAVYTALGSYPL